MAPLENGLRDRILKLTLGDKELEEVAEREIGWADDKVCEHGKRFYEDEGGERPGMYGAITARGEAQVVRLTLLDALLDGAEAMKVEHLEAAIAIWRYCLASARHIFGDSLGDGVADTVMAALRSAGHKGMTRSALRDLFGRHAASAGLGWALALLLRLRLVICASRDTGGRSSETWQAAD